MEDITILLNRAIPIDEKMNVFIRKHHRPVPVADFRAQSGTYISNSTIIAFSFNGNLYMLPYSRKIIAILWDNGFLRSTDYTFKPYFANPFQHSFEWMELQNAAHSSKMKNFETDCLRFSDYNSIKELPSELLITSTEVPNSGLKFGMRMYYPVFSTTVLDKYTTSLIGKFYHHDGTTVFVYRDGKTYVSQNLDLPEVLPFYGYSPTSWLRT